MYTNSYGFSNVKQINKLITDKCLPLNNQKSTDLFILQRPYTDSDGNTIGLYFNTKHSLIAGIITNNGKQINLIGENILNGLTQQPLSDEQVWQIVQRPESFVTVFNKDKCRALVFPYLAAAKDKYTHYLVTDKNNPFAGKSFEQVNNMLKNGFKDPCTGQFLKATKEEKRGDYGRGVYHFKDQKIDIVLDPTKQSGHRTEPAHVDVMYKHAKNANGQFDKLKFPLNPNDPAWGKIKMKECKQLPDYTKGRGPNGDPDGNGPGGGGGGGGGGNNKPGSGGSSGSFENHVNQNGLADSYNSSNPNNQIAKAAGNAGDIGGVAILGPNAIMVDFNNDDLYDLTAKGYYLAFPRKYGIDQIPQDELDQLIREMAIASYIFDTNPFYSLHFNSDGSLYSVIHPVFQNTLVGQVIGMLDYFMKGYLNGGYFTENDLFGFIDNYQSWKKDPGILKPFIKSMESLYKSSIQNGKEYVSLTDRLEEFNVEQYKYNETSEISSNKQLLQRFQISFRIIAKQNSIEKSGDTIVFNGDFDVFYTIELRREAIGDLDIYQESHEYKIVDHFCRKTAEDIKVNFSQIPMFSKYFAKLELICGLAYYFNSLKKQQLAPKLTRHKVNSALKCPGYFPPYPRHSYKVERSKITFWDLVKGLSKEHRNQLNRLLSDKVENLTPELQSILTQSLKEVLLLKAFKFTELEINIIVSMYYAKVVQTLDSIREEVNSEATKEIVTKLTSAVIQANHNITELDNISTSIREQMNNHIAELTWQNNQAKRSIPAYLVSIYDEKFNKLIGEIRKEVNEKVNKISSAITEEQARKRELEEKLSESTTISINIIVDPTDQKISENIEFNLPKLKKEVLGIRFANENDSVKINGGTGFALDSMPIKKSAIPRKINAALTESKLKEPTKFTERSIQSVSINGSYYNAFYISHTELNQDSLNLIENSVINENMAQTATEIRLIELASAPASPEQLQEIKELMQNLYGRSILKTDAYGNNILHLAVMRNNLELYKLLVTNQELHESFNRFGERPIHLICMLGFEELLKATPKNYWEALNINRESGLYLAVVHNKINIVKRYINSCLNVNILELSEIPSFNINEAGISGIPLIYTAFFNGHKAIGEFLLRQYNINITFKIENGNTLLHLVTQLNYPDVVEQLIKKGADPKAMNRDGKIPLHIAAENGNLEVAKLLVRAIGQIDIKDSSGLTALNLSIVNGHYEVAKYLIAKGADLNIIVNGNNALSYLLKAKELELANIILKRNKYQLNLNSEVDIANFKLICGLGYWELAQKIIKVMPALVTEMLVKDPIDNIPANYLEYLCISDQAIILRELINSKDSLNKVTRDYLTENKDKVYRLVLKYKAKLVLAILLKIVKNPFDYHELPFKACSQDNYQFKEYSLIQFAVRNNLPLIYTAYFKSQDADLTITTCDGKNLLYLAAESGNQLLIKQLLAKGINPVSMNGRHIFYPLVENNDSEIIKNLLLIHRFDVNCIIDEAQQLRAIDLAFTQGNIDTIISLIGYGAKFNQKNSQDQLPIFYAIKNNAFHVIRLLFKYELGDLGEILDFAVANFKNEVITEILQHRPNYRELVLEHAVALFNTAIRINNVVLCKLLFNIGFEPERDIQLLTNAIKFGRHEILELLIPKYPTFNTPDIAGNTPLHLACIKGDGNCVSTLLSNSLNDCDMLNNSGKKAIELAPNWIREFVFQHKMSEISSRLISLIEAGDLRAIQEILDQYQLPATLQISYVLGSQNINVTLLEIAAIECRIDVLRFLLQRCSKEELTNYAPTDLSYIHFLMKIMDASSVEKLIDEFNVDINTRSIATGYTPMFIAVMASNIALINYLVAKNINLYQEAQDGMTIMFLAIKNKSIEIVKLLVENHKYQINHKTNAQKTCLGMAFREGNLLIAEYLVKMGADIYATNGFRKQSILHNAVISQDEKTVFYAISLGLNCNCEDAMGMTPLHLAAKHGNLKIVKLLVNFGADSMSFLDKRGRNALDFAMIHKKPEVSKYLTCNTSDYKLEETVEEEVNFKLYRHSGRSSIEIAIISADYNTIMRLIKRVPANDKRLIDRIIAIAGASPNPQIFSSILTEFYANANLINLSNCLYAAIVNDISYNVAELVKLIGAEVTFEDGNTPIEVACEHGSIEAAKILLNHLDEYTEIPIKVAFNALKSIIKKNNLALAKLVLPICDEFVVDYKDGDGNTLLHHAVLNNRPNMVAFLLMNGAQDCQNHNNLTATDLSHKFKYDLCEKYLNFTLADKLTNAKATNITNPLLNYLENNQAVDYTVIQWLCTFSDLNELGKNGLNPLQLANKMNDKQLIKILLDAGATLNLLTADASLNAEFLTLEDGLEYLIKNDHELKSSYGQIIYEKMSNLDTIATKIKEYCIEQDYKQIFNIWQITKIKPIKMPDSDLESFNKIRDGHLSIYSLLTNPRTLSSYTEPKMNILELALIKDEEPFLDFLIANYTRLNVNMLPLINSILALTTPKSEVMIHLVENNKLSLISKLLPFYDSHFYKQLGKLDLTNLRKQDTNLALIALLKGYTKLYTLLTTQCGINVEFGLMNAKSDYLCSIWHEQSKQVVPDLELITKSQTMKEYLEVLTATPLKSVQLACSRILESLFLSTNDDLTEAKAKFLLKITQNDNPANLYKMFKDATSTLSVIRARYLWLYTRLYSTQDNYSSPLLTAYNEKDNLSFLWVLNNIDQNLYAEEPQLMHKLRAENKLKLKSQMFDSFKSWREQCIKSIIQKYDPSIIYDKSFNSYSSLVKIILSRLTNQHTIEHLSTLGWTQLFVVFDDALSNLDKNSQVRFMQRVYVIIYRDTLYKQIIDVVLANEHINAIKKTTFEEATACTLL